MNHRTTALTATTLLTVALAGLTPVAAHADTADDPWQFSASIYLWLPSLSGTAVFPVDAGGSSIEATTEDLLDALNMGFMGTFGAKKGRWGVWSDLVYADLGGDKQGSHDFTVGGQPVSVSADLSLDMKMWIWTAAGTYELAKTPENTTDLVFGARLLDIPTELGWTFNGSAPGGITHSGSADAGDSLWDAIIGVKGVAYLGADKKWFIPYYADIGTGQSDLTWQVNAGIGYRYDWGSVAATWRYLDYNLKPGYALETLTASGLLIGVNWQW